MDFRTYDSLKVGLADVLRSVPWRASEAIRNRDLFARLAEDRFNLVVVGGYSRGKSTLMNAILGIDRLPTGVEPLTSVITSVTYGSDERLTLHFHGTSLFLDASLDAIADYVTECGNPGNRRRIREAEIQLPAEFLRGGFRFVDTPGLGSHIVENTRATEDFLEEADAFILVSSCDASFAAEDAELARHAREANRRLFVVLNKMDQIPPGQREAAVAATLDRLGIPMREIGHSVFPISAQDALRARLDGDPSRLEASGLPDLEAVLLRYVLTDKRRDFLLGLCDRIQPAIDGEGVIPIRARLDVIRQHAAHLGAEDVLLDQAEHRGASRAFRPCDVCEQVETETFNYLTQVQVALRESAALRDDFVRRGGLCGAHARQLARLTAPREICTAFAPVLLDRAHRLLELARDGLGDGDLARMMPGHQGCPACELEAAVEDRKRLEMADMLDDGRRDPDGLSSLCMPHGIGLVASLINEEVRSRTLRRLSLDCRRLAEDMQRSALKQDASRRDAMSAEERHAWSRGLEVLVGRENAEPAARRVGVLDQTSTSSGQVRTMEASSP